MSMSLSRANPFVVLKNMLALLHSSNLGHYLCAGLCLCPCLCLLWFVVGSSKLLSVGMGWNWVQGGDTLYVAVFSLSSCHGHIWQNLVNFFAKSACHIYCRGGGEKLGSKYHSNPQNRVFFLWVVSLCQNWGPLSKIEGQRLWWSHWLLLLLRQHIAEAFPAGIQLCSNKDATDKETIRNYFSKIEGLSSILEN